MVIVVGGDGGSWASRRCPGATLGGVIGLVGAEPELAPKTQPVSETGRDRRRFRGPSERKLRQSLAI